MEVLTIANRYDNTTDKRYYEAYPFLPDTLKHKLTPKNIIENYSLFTRGYKKLYKINFDKAIELRGFCRHMLIDYINSIVDDINSNTNINIFNNLHVDFLFLKEIENICDKDCGEFINLPFLRVLSHICYCINKINDDSTRNYLTYDFLTGYLEALSLCF